MSDNPQKNKAFTLPKLSDKIREVKSGKNVVDTNFWTNNQMSQSVVSWRGIAFEELFS